MVFSSKSKLIPIHKLIEYSFSELCKFHKNFYISNGGSKTLENSDTKEECAINVHKTYADATGAAWYDYNEYNYCIAHFGDKFTYEETFDAWSCLFQPLYQGNAYSLRFKAPVVIFRNKEP